MLKYLALAGILSGAALLPPAETRDDPVPKKVVDLGLNHGVWRAFDAPNGAYYIIDGDSRVAVIRKDGAEIARIDNAMNVSVSARANRIVFLRSSDAQGTPMNWKHVYAWTATVDGTTGKIVDPPRRATIHPCVYAETSPNGDRIMCARNDNGNWSIYTVPASGGDEHPVITRPARTFEPVWSPDGRWIYYELDGGGTQPHMERVPSEGGKAQTVSPPGRPLGFSRDGKYYAVGTNKGPTVRIYRAGDNRLITTVAMWGRPTWSASKPRTLVAGVNDAPSTLKSISFPDGAIHALPALSAWAYEPHFTPEGKHLVYRATIEGRTQFVIADRDGKNARAISTRAEPLENFSMAPDSRSVGFATPMLDSAYVLDLASGKSRGFLPLGHVTDIHWRSDGQAQFYVKALTPSNRELRQITLDGRDTRVRDIGNFGIGSPLQFVSDTEIASLDRTGVHVMSLRTGATRTLVAGRATTGSIGQRLFVSPDKQWIGFELDDSTGSGIATLASLDGTKRVSVGQSLPCGASVIGWHPNNRDVFLHGFTQCDTAEFDNVYSASREGGPMRNLTGSEPPGNLGSFSIHPDGTQIVYNVSGANRGAIYTLDLSKVLP